MTIDGWLMLAVGIAFIAFVVWWYVASASWEGPVVSDPTAQRCDHNCIPCSRWFRSGWVCVRCNAWSRPILPRLCPDCRLGPDQGVDGECYWCREAWETQQRDNAVYASGYDDGYRASASGEELKP